MLNRKYIFKRCIFHCHVSFFGGVICVFFPRCQASWPWLSEEFHIVLRCSPQVVDMFFPAAKQTDGILLPWKLTCPLKINGWRCIPYWNSHFLGDMLVFGGVLITAPFCSRGGVLEWVLKGYLNTEPHRVWLEHIVFVYYFLTKLKYLGKQVAANFHQLYP